MTETIEDLFAEARRKAELGLPDRHQIVVPLTDVESLLRRMAEAMIEEGCAVHGCSPLAAEWQELRQRIAALGREG